MGLRALGRSAKMKRLRSIVTIAIIATSSCNRSEETAQAGAATLNRHEAAVTKFQDGQKRFNNLIATVRDEQTYDEARPGLDRIVVDWREVATALSDLDPPSTNEQANFRKMIAEGHRRTEPTADDMLRLFSIKTRETQISAWLEDFAAAAGKAGGEMLRLYGPTGYAADVTKVPDYDSSNAAIIGRAFEQALENPSTHTPKNQEAEQGGADQPATAPELKSEGNDKPQPESKLAPR